MISFHSSSALPFTHPQLFLPTFITFFLFLGFSFLSSKAFTFLRTSFSSLYFVRWASDTRLCARPVMTTSKIRPTLQLKFIQPSGSNLRPWSCLTLVVQTVQNGKLELLYICANVYQTKSLHTLWFIWRNKWLKSRNWTSCFGRHRDFCSTPDKLF